MQRNEWNGVVLANKTTQQFYKVLTPCLDDHQFEEEEWNHWEKCQVYALKIVLKYLYLARIGGPDMLWSVNKLARAITKWPEHVTNV